MLFLLYVSNKQTCLFRLNIPFVSSASQVRILSNGYSRVMIVDCFATLKVNDIDILKECIGLLTRG